MFLDGIGQIRYAIPRCGRGDHHLRWRARDAAAGRRHHGAQLTCGTVRAGTIALVHGDDVRHLEQSRLDGLDLVPHVGHLDDHRRLRQARDLDLGLAGADGLDQDRVVSGRIQCGRRNPGRGGQAAELAARRHGAHEHVAVGGVLHHPDPVAEDGTTRIGGGRIHGQDSHAPAATTPFADERVDERRLPASRRPGDTDDVSARTRGEQPGQQLPDRWVPVLDPGQQAGEWATLSRRELIHHGSPAYIPDIRLGSWPSDVLAEVAGDLSDRGAGPEDLGDAGGLELRHVGVGNDPAGRHEHLVHAAFPK